MIKNKNKNKNINIVLFENNLEISGFITFNDIAHLLDVCIEKTSKFDVINVDLKNLETLNSSVLIFIINYIRSAIRHKQTIKFLNIPDLLIELSKVYNLNKIITFEEENKIC